MEKIKAYTGKDNYIFVSYAHKDKNLIYPIIKELQKKYNVWFDEGLHWGREWELEIVEKIKKCSLFIYMITQNSLDSPNCNDEIAFAKSRNVPFINVCVEEIELPDVFTFSYGRYQMCFYYRYHSLEDFIEDFENKIEGLSDIKKKKNEKPIKTNNVYPIDDGAGSFQKAPFSAEDNTNKKRAITICSNLNTLFEKNLKSAAKCSHYKIGCYYTLFTIEYSCSLKKLKSVINEAIIPITSGLSYRFDESLINENTLGFEIANKFINEVIVFDDVIDKLPSKEEHPLSIGFGLDINFKLEYHDLDELPHILIGGTTGSGKSMFINSIITSLSMRNSPDYLRFILVDPKRVELNKYKNSPFLLCPIVQNPFTARFVFKKLKDEMYERYDLFANSEIKATNIKEYNEKAKIKGLKTLPYIVAIIDEFADLIYNNKALIDSLISLVQKARAAGIHLIISTQRTIASVMSNALKVNMPAKVAFMTASASDSISLIGKAGAEKLLGLGDMLFSYNSNELKHLHACFIPSSFIKSIESNIESKYSQVFDSKFLDDPEEADYHRVKDWAMGEEYISMSMIQREFAFGFNKANRMFNRLVEENIVSSESTNKGCKVLKRK